MGQIEKKYENFIEELVSQISPLLPDDVNELQKNYLITNVRKSATMLAESMPDNDEFSKLKFEEKCFYIQVMAEWSFHKEIDLFRSGIPAKYWKVVMQKIWYTMWEVMYACVKNEAPVSSALVIIERYVNRTYNDAVEDLKSQNLIDETIEEQAKEQSNLKKMAQEYIIEQRTNSNIKFVITKLILAIVISAAVSFAIIKFKTTGLIVILVTLILYNILPNRKS